MPKDSITDPAWVATAHPDTQGVYAYWKAKRGDRLMPARADLDPADLVPYLPTIMLVDVRPGRSITGGPVYVYRLVGTAEVAVRGQDPTGQPVETHGHGLTLLDAVRNYDQVVESRAPWFDGYETLLTDQDLRDGESVFLPLSGNGQDVDMILVFTVQEKLVRSYADTDLADS
jgi:hypothetical protein